VGTTKHVSPYERVTGSVKCSHSNVNYYVNHHRAAAHSLITNILFHLLIILKPSTGMTPVPVAAYHSELSINPN
jgi:hypothetical protein